MAACLDRLELATFNRLVAGSFYGYFHFMRKVLRAQHASYGATTALALVLLGASVLPNGYAAASASSFTPKDFTNHVQQLSKKVPTGFALVVQPPFVVLGDESARDVQFLATHTVKWAVDRLKQDYFSRDPAEIIDIWLFKDTASYEKNTRKLFNETPTTPFGYFSAQHHALIMNIGTGGGTLVHEIVHPFMAANFPQCPTWLNEGLASLYEQCGDKGGHIYGYTNWRLSGLQTAIKSGKTFPFAKLFAMDGNEFYSDRGLKYAQARYLCYYLQEQQLLVKFFKEFQAHTKDDPTGVKSLKKVLARDDLVKFQKEWEGFVLRLVF